MWNGLTEPRARYHGKLKHMAETNSSMPEIQKGGMLMWVLPFNSVGPGSGPLANVD